MSKEEKLQKLEKEMEKDETLPLKKGANRLVFGVGNPETKILLIGEGPGYWEDQKGEPFVGNAGKFLDTLLASAKLEREDVFITNVVHHRPPNNRDPFPNELDAYGKYLDQIIETISPKVIVTLGRFSMAKFLPNVKISGVHGKASEVEWKGKEIVVMPMYHPAAGLRNGNVREATIKDFEKLPEVIEKSNQIKTEQIELL